MPTFSRRQIIASMTAASAAFAIQAPALAITASSPTAANDIEIQLQKLECEHGGRLGVALMNCSTGAIASHRGNERFLFNSTSKLFIAAAVLARVDSGQETFDHRLVVSESDLGGWTPITEKQLGEPGITVAELCQAAVAWSDNAAANVLIRSVGGPEAVTAYLRSISDDTTRLDRYEPDLNEHDHEGDERDTTTPLAMMKTLQLLLLGEVLLPSSRHQLAAWMIEGKTGDARLRAGMPASWLVGEKTGTNGVGNANDIGVAWPADRGAVIAIAYTFMPNASKEQRDKAIALIGKIASNV
ncbi:class A beta-lactamase [Pseudomonas sp.]|uniref:class A beta-lactamase n=1 Tax=Pseudomonas sp. TaxID=306 RepID=UPI0024884811|nr:class A beta-lactamase [Pseudomonas sp.]MDI1330614.1 class A beta-lactamase [Pseudomonas sp.]